MGRLRECMGVLNSSSMRSISMASSSANAGESTWWRIVVEVVVEDGTLESVVGSRTNWYRRGVSRPDWEDWDDVAASCSSAAGGVVSIGWSWVAVVEDLRPIWMGTFMASISVDGGESWVLSSSDRSTTSMCIVAIHRHMSA